MRTPRQPGGFSLIELMVAMAIAMIIFGVGFVAITAAIDTRKQYTASVRAAESARQFFSLLERDLAAGYPSDYAPVYLDNGLAYSGPAFVPSGPSAFPDLP